MTDHCVLAGTNVYPVVVGTVVRVEWFTGVNSTPPTPWWCDTQAVWVRSGAYVFVYGEVRACVHVGDFVTTETVLGTVTRVLKTDKGLPVSMLHLEVYYHEPEETAIWHHGEPCPRGLLDPDVVIEDLTVAAYNDILSEEELDLRRIQRVSGDYICEYCQLPYRKHPYNLKYLMPESVGGGPYLHESCDGRLLKL